VILTVTGLKKSFGGLMAINRVDFSIPKGEINAIIGPNGAGKTTFFNLITGFIRPDSGKIIFESKDITGEKPQHICQFGVARAFQIVNIFPRLSVLKSIQIAIFSRQKKARHLFSYAKKVAKDEALEIIESVGLMEKVEELGGALSQGDQKRLEIGIALAQQPKLLLLDEPTAGMSSLERGSTMELIQKLSQKKDLTILFTEHDMDVVFTIANKIWVLHQGSIIFDGTPEEVKNNEIVQKVYLGEETKCS
jgi:branched-chain amino acid transport system ATP-binding protein